MRPFLDEAFGNPSSGQPLPLRLPNNCIEESGEVVVIAGAEHCRRGA
jgi:hypothetical protein